jgi:Ca-activated chloride channel family protein
MRPKRAEVISAALAFARSSNPEDQIFITNFNENVSFALPASTPFTNNIDQLEVALSKFATTGKTALYDAVAASLEHIKKGSLDKRVMIVISDGGDNASKLNLAQIMTMAGQSNTIIYTIGIFDEGDPDRNPDVLEKLARATGGVSYFPTLVKDVVPICKGIAHDFRNQYTISYSPKNIKQDGTYRIIQVKATVSGHEHLSVRTRAGYYAQLKP